MNKLKAITMAVGLIAWTYIITSSLDRRHYERERKRAWEESIRDRQVFAPYTHATQTLVALEASRGGDISRVTEQLEQQLDEDLISIWYYFKQNPGSPHDSYVAEIISKIQEYRKNNPSWHSKISQVEWEGKTLDGSQALAEVLTWTNAPSAK
jgi:hypothetical protein